LRCKKRKEKERKSTRLILSHDTARGDSLRRVVSFPGFLGSRKKRKKESEGRRYVAEERRAKEALRFETVRLKCQTATGEIFISLITV